MALAGTACGLIAALLVVDSRAARPETNQGADCGLNALFVLLRFEGRPVSLARLGSALPSPVPGGYSMAELSEAARSLGLELEGVRFTKGDKPIDRPAIALVRDGRGGHFVVLRPVGTTGTMVQVIAPPRVPWITDYDRLVASRPWTGLILLPRDPWLLRYALPLLFAGLGIPLVSLSVWWWGHSPGPTRPDLPPAASGPQQTPHRLGPDRG